MRLPGFKKGTEQTPAPAAAPATPAAPAQPAAPQAPQVQQVLVPTVVSSEEMLNIIYQQNAKILQILEQASQE